MSSPRNSAGPSMGAKSGQKSILGFFKKVDGPVVKASPSSAALNPPAAAPAKSSSSSLAAAERPYAKSQAPLPSPPSSVSGGSVSPVASTSKRYAAPTTLGTNAGVCTSEATPFKTPSRPDSRSRPKASASTATAASKEPTPPASSPAAAGEAPAMSEADDDEDEGMPSSTRRRKTVQKRKSYYESGSEGDEGSDYEASAAKSRGRRDVIQSEESEDDDEDAAESDATLSPEPMRKRPAPKAARSSLQSQPAPKKPRPSASSFSSAPPSRPPLPHASTSSSSRGSPSGGKSNEGFSFLADRRDMDGHRPDDADFDPRTLRIGRREWESMTNFERQYFEIKQYNMDTILMFQKGKFYEMFLEDAYTVHRELDLKLTDRGRMPMVGVPESSFDMFATKLLAMGYKVGRVDQMETAVGKGMRDKKASSSGDIVRRELRHVMTTGTMIDGLEDDQASYCVALVEHIRDNDGQQEVSFAVCTLDAATSDFGLAHWVDDQQLSSLETLLSSLRVKEIIHKKGQLSKNASRLIRNCVGADCRITMLRDGKEWLTPDATEDALKELFGGDESAIPQAIQSVRDNELAMSALAGMFAYLAQLSLLRDLSASKNFTLLEDRKAARGRPMHLDANTLNHLCVLSNEDGSDAGTLHRLLNRCITPAGRRLFKIWLTHPLSDAASIAARQDAVEDLVGNTEFEDCFAKLKKLPDFERLMPKVSSGKIKPVDFTGLLTAFKRMTPIVQDLLQVTAGFKSQLVQQLLESIPDVAQLAAELDEMFVAEEDGSFEPTQGTDEAFDTAHRNVEAVEEELEAQLRACRKQFGLGAQKSGGCNWKHRGTNEIYQIEVPKKTKVPKDWQLVSQTNASIGYYSPDVRDLVLALKESRETRTAALKQFQAGLFARFHEESGQYLTAVRALGEIDCLQSLALASYAMGEPTCRPELVECDTALVDFEDLRHPCIAVTTDFIANDVSMGGDSAEVILLTGGNMAGKSTTARTTATAVILAQMGCRIPAKSAKISPTDRICTRMGANDQIFKNSSTFMVEMLEASRIVKDCTPRSLIIMDELGRGTSTFDGHAIAHSVLHHLIARTRCLCFFLTHYLQLAYDFQDYPRCANKHMAVAVDDEKREVVFTYRLVDGVAESSYGTQVAHLAGVSAKICDRASDISKEFALATKQQQAQKTTSALPMSTLSDFAYLFGLGQRGASGDEGSQLAAQLEVIRAQVQRIGDLGCGNQTAGARLKEDVEMAIAPPTSASAPSNTKGQELSSPRATYGKRSATYGGHKRSSSDRGMLSSPHPVKRSATASRSNDAAGAGAASPSRSSATANGNSKILAPRKQEQLVLDLGQQMQVTCRECSMSYDRSSTEDAMMHTKYHDRVLRGVEWPRSMAAEAPLATFAISGSKVTSALGKQVIQAALKRSMQGSNGVDLDDLLASSSTPGQKEGPGSSLPVRIHRYDLSAHSINDGSTTSKKLREVLGIIDDSLGASALPSEVLHQSCQLFVAVCASRVVGGVVATTRLDASKVRRVVGRRSKGTSCGEEQTHSTATQDTSGDALFVSSQPLSSSESAPPIGIHRIYVLPTLRRCGLARFLLEVVLDHSVYGLDARAMLKQFGGRGESTKAGDSGDDEEVGSRGRCVAFSQPTEAGRRLAQSWVGGDEADLLIFQE